MELKKAIDQYVRALNENAKNERWANELSQYTYRVEYLKKYARIVMERRNDAGAVYGRSVHSFVVLNNGFTKSLGHVLRGDIMKPASWKTPARHARGTVFAEKWEQYGADIYGANYMR